MIPQQAVNVVRGVATDVGGEIIRNVSQAEPVTAQGLADSLKSSAASRVQKGIPLPLSPIARTIGDITSKNGNQTKTKDAPKGRKGGNGKKSGNGKGKGNGNGGRNKSSGGNQQSPASQPNTSAYGNIDHGSLYTIQSDRDTSYWADVLQNQAIDYPNKNASRTAILTIKTDHDDILQPGNSAKLQTAYSSIYMQKLSEAIGSTGGNASVKNSFTENNFWQHQRYALSACLKLAEVYTIRAWDPPYEETNTVIRQMKNALCSDVGLMDATNRLEEAIAQYALPAEAIRNAIALFQTYKKSPVSGGVHTRLMSTELLNDLRTGDDFPNTRSSMNTLSGLMTDTAWTQNNGTVTSLLLHKCSGFISCRTQKVGAQYPTYQMDFNAIFDNMKYAWENSGQDYVSDEPSTSQSILVAFPFDVGNVPKHVSSSLLLRYELFGSTQTGFPWFSLKDEADGSRFIGTNDVTKTYKIGFDPIGVEFSDITDNNFSIIDTRFGAYFKPIGLNTQLFQPTYPVVVNATRDILYNVYSMPSMS